VDTEVIAFDSAGSSPPDTFRWTVTAPVLVPPVLVTPIPDQTGAVGGTTSLNVTGNFTGETSFTATPLPAGVSFNAGVFSGTFTNVQSVDTTVTAINADGSTPDTFNWGISAAATPPVLVLPIPDVYRLVNVPLAGGSIAGYFTGATSYTAAPLPTGVTFNGADGTFGGTPTVLGDTSIVVTAINAQGSTQDTFIVHIVVVLPTTDTDDLVKPLINKLVRSLIQ
jgi:hypothetical protein